MLRALQVAAQVPVWLERRAEGRVHSLYTRACNLLWGEDTVPGLIR